MKTMAAKRVLIVPPHPEPKSFTAPMKLEAVKTFEELRFEVRFSDLYAKRFNPVARTGLSAARR
jgi:NAD(P)H dehydrogenase (quinone)